MKRYRFFITDNAGRTWYLLDDKKSFSLHKPYAEVFTEADCDWAAGADLEREELGEDELMRRAGAPRLPGLEA